MKIGGKPVTKCFEVLVLPRVDGDIVIKAEAAAINDEFNAMVPLPVPPNVRTKDGPREDLEDQDYLAALERRENLRWAYMCLKSLVPSNIEWDTVDLSKPATWGKWQEELLEAGLSEVEIQRIQACVSSANSLDERKLREARESFLLGQE